jgi:hypothetical protein
MQVKASKPDEDGSAPAFWHHLFGRNVFDIVFGAHPERDDWHQTLRLDYDLREHLVDITTQEAIRAWENDLPTKSQLRDASNKAVPDNKTVKRYPKEVVVEAAKNMPKPPAVKHSEPHVVVVPVPEKPVFHEVRNKPVSGTVAEKMLAFLPQDLNGADVSKILTLAGQQPIVLLIKGGKKFLFRDKSFITMDESGVRAEK